MKVLLDADGGPSIEGAALTPLLKGWSGDKKYRVETADGERFLLRVAEKTQYKQMKADVADMHPTAMLGRSAQQPVALGKSGAWAYTLLTWIDGKELSEVLPALSAGEQYTMGLQAGALLKQIHSAAPVRPPEDGDTLFRQNISEAIARHVSIGMSPDSSRMVIAYLEENRDLPGGRPRVFSHGDYNTGNLIVTPNGTLGAIDFLAYFGDPWREFLAVPVGEETNPHYHTGLLNGYFSGEPPAEFFAVLAYYGAVDALTRVSPDDPPNVLDAGCRHIRNIFRWFDHFQRTVPIWYLQDWRNT